MISIWVYDARVRSVAIFGIVSWEGSNEYFTLYNMFILVYGILAVDRKIEQSTGFAELKMHRWMSGA